MRLHESLRVVSKGAYLRRQRLDLCVALWKTLPPRIQRLQRVCVARRVSHERVSNCEYGTSGERVRQVKVQAVWERFENAPKRASQKQRSGGFSAALARHCAPHDVPVIILNLGRVVQALHEHLVEVTLHLLATHEFGTEF